MHTLSGVSTAQGVLLFLAFLLLMEFSLWFSSTVVRALLFLSSLQMLMAPGVACVPAAVPNVFASFRVREVPVVADILAVDVILMLLLISLQLSASHLFLAPLLLLMYLLLLVFLVC